MRKKSAVSQQTCVRQVFFSTDELIVSVMEYLLESNYVDMAPNVC
jgi:hypothetical protein